MSLCGCGCGQPVKEGKKYIFNHYWIGKHRSDATKKKIAKSHLGQLTGDKNPSKRPEVREKIRLKRLKDWQNPEYRNKMINGRRKYYLNGGKNSNHGKPLSEDHRKKIGESQKGEKNNNWQGGNETIKCIVCGKLFEVKPGRLKKGEGKYCSMKCYHSLMRGPNHPWWQGGNEIIRCIVCGEYFEVKSCRKDEAKYCSMKCCYTVMRGSNHHCWQGGSSFEPYSPEFNSELKSLIRERDGYRCLWCGDDGEDLGYLQIHHIDYDKKNSIPSNLITLCVVCHAQTNHNRDFWQNCLSELIAN